MYSSLNDFLLFYKKFLLQSWNNMGPTEYVVTLVSVGLIGWFMMRKAGTMT
jgi:hypothetical protein